MTSFAYLRTLAVVSRFVRYQSLNFRWRYWTQESLITVITAQTCPTITSTITTGCPTSTQSGCGPQRICDAYAVATNPCNCPSLIPRTAVTTGCQTNSAGCYTRGCYTSWGQTNGCTSSRTTSSSSSATATSNSPSPASSNPCPVRTYWTQPSATSCPGTRSVCTTSQRPSGICDLLEAITIPCGCPSTPASTTLPCTTKCETLRCGTFAWNYPATNCISTTCK